MLAEAIGSEADAFCSGAGHRTDRANFSITEPTRGNHQGGEQGEKEV